MPDPGAPAPRPPARRAGRRAQRAACTPTDETQRRSDRQANPRQVGRARNIAEQTSAILQFYASIVGEAPYPSFTLAVTENELPGGHSPAYFAVLNQVLPTTPIVWRNDPVNFESYPDVLSRARAGAPVVGPGGRLEELPRAVAERGLRAVFRRAVRREGARRRTSSRPCCGRCGGPASTRRRRGRSISATGSATSAASGRSSASLVYNKSAMVLHMLRRLVGDEAFFFGLRRFYAEWRFKKAGTDDFRVAMEAATGRDLGPFFEAWIFGVAIPRVALQPTARRTRAARRQVRAARRGRAGARHGDADLHQRRDRVRRRPGDGTVVERTLPVNGALRKVDANEDNARAGRDREASAISDVNRALTRELMRLRQVDRRDPAPRHSARTARRRG